MEKSGIELDASSVLGDLLVKQAGKKSQPCILPFRFLELLEAPAYSSSSFETMKPVEDAGHDLAESKLLPLVNRKLKFPGLKLKRERNRLGGFSDLEENTLEVLSSRDTVFVKLDSPHSWSSTPEFIQFKSLLSSALPFL